MVSYRLQNSTSILTTMLGVLCICFFFFSCAEYLFEQLHWMWSNINSCQKIFSLQTVFLVQKKNEFFSPVIVISQVTCVFVRTTVENYSPIQFLIYCSLSFYLWLNCISRPWSLEVLLFLWKGFSQENLSEFMRENRQAGIEMQKTHVT